MTVEELIEVLRTFPQDREVITEGCDCMGSSSGVTTGEKYWKGEDGENPYKNTVVITRDDDD